MKKILAIVIAAVLMLSLIPSVALAGTGLPDGVNGYHFTLNIIGVQNPKTADMDSEKGRGSTIFVDLFGKNKIYLQEYEGENFKDAFAVLDANATDSDGALFQLPPPGYDAYVIGEDPSPETTYSIFVRPLGTPGGWTTITTCAELVDEAGLYGMLPGAALKAIKNEIRGTNGLNNIYASVEQVGQAITERKTGKSNFTNVTAELTSIVFKVWIDLDGDELEDPEEIFYVRVPIFDELLANEYWEYDNNYLKHLQVRFYEVPTSLALADSKF